MTFEHPWILLLAILPALWAFKEWRDSARRVALCLKATGLAAVLIALAEPLSRHGRLYVQHSRLWAGWHAKTIEEAVQKAEQIQKQAA